MESCRCIWKFRLAFLACLANPGVALVSSSDRSRSRIVVSSFGGGGIRRRGAEEEGERREVEKRRWLKPIETIGDQCSVIPLGNGGGLETKSS